MIKNLRGRGMAQQHPLPVARPYRWRNTPGWNPAAALTIEEPKPVPASLARRQEETARRTAEFARLRDEGMRVGEAGAAVGVSHDTARRYERRRREAAMRGDAG